MALPLKSGADLYNNQALRMRLHNLGADPTEVGAGLIYFNTSSGLNTSQKARLYTGSAWKTIAFSEDLDVASNADFLALKERVDLLSGEVDTDAIISNMKEVSAFLEGFAEDASLMDLLNSKLNTSGGTISGNLTLNQYLQIKAWEGYGSGMAQLWFDGNKKELQWQGVEKIKIGTNDILTSAGGTIEGNYDALTIKRNSSYASLIRYSNADGVMGYLGFSNANNPSWYPSDLTTSYALLHSGNVGEYALKRVNNVTSLDNVNAGEFFFSAYQATNRPATNFAGGATFQIYKTSGGDEYRVQLAFGTDANGYIRGYNGTTWTSWKTIAFTDSTVDKAKTLVDRYGLSVVSVANSILDLNRNASSGEFYNSANMGLEVECKATEIIFKGYKTDGQLGGRIFLNSSGNVTIGASDLAGTDAKLYVDGHIKLGASGYLYKNDKTVIDFAGDAPLFGYGTAAAGLGTKVYGFDISLYYGGTTNVGFILNSSGNVLIGTTTDNGAKLQVNGDLHVSGNIIADGEVSAGGAAEEGGNAGSGGAFHSESIAVGATQTTIAHGLGTDDIVVSIYEKDGVSGRWSIILTDVEIVDANNIIVSFGSATSVEHKVVIMGAVA